MDASPQRVLRIVDGARYEVNEGNGQWKPGQKLRAGPLAYVRTKSNGLSFGPGYRTFMEVAGPAHAAATFGIFIKLLEVGASRRAESRWFILDHHDQPASYTSLAYFFGFPEKQIKHAVKILADPRLRWIEWVDAEIHREVPGSPRISVVSPELRGVPGNPLQDKTVQDKQEGSSDPPVLVFPAVGKPTAWNLSEAKIQQYRETYPGIDVLAQCREARQWLIDNPSRGKTARGMAAYLNRWLSKEQDRCTIATSGLPQQRTLIDVTKLGKTGGE